MSLAIATLSVATTATAQDLPPVLDHYPDCQYDTISSASVKKKFVIKSGSIDRESEQRAIREAIFELRQQAQNAQAYGVILTGWSNHVARWSNVLEDVREGGRLDNHKPELEVFGDLIGHCDGAMRFSNRVTPINQYGQQQMALGGIHGLKKTIVFNVEPGNPRYQPTLAHSIVDFDRGAYGAKLGMTMSQIEQVYGTPSLRFAMTKDTVLLSYGRRQWLVFNNDQLVEITTENRWFSSDLVNHIPFDERFDDDQWQLWGTVSNNTAFDQLKSKIDKKMDADDHSVVIQDGDQQLTLWLTGVVENNNQISRKVTGYTLSQQHVEQTKLALNPNQINAVISNHFNQQTETELESQHVEDFAIGEIWVSKTAKMLLFDDHVTVLLKGKSVDKLYFLEHVFSDQWQPRDQPWSFLRVSQGQSMEDAIAILGDDAFAEEDSIELMADNYSKELYFYDGKLIAAEVTIY
ncbi:hypothetical protein GCM10011369_25550 [Neiella marina]|uniref:Uncharacterized protein n=2 Tax=Neiella marina TaxID=508461 RepID=A0A8J2XPT4_9GAMM|nr:hypothetical protein GCM10011369_25550 [Neiella marina]